MELENILYAGVQIAHNFGAAAVTGLPIAALCLAPEQPAARKIARCSLFAWLTQCASGADFGVVSFTMEGELPQIHSFAIVALGVKILCAALALSLLAMNLVVRVKTPLGNRAWISLTVLGVTALTWAAILRWFS